MQYSVEVNFELARRLSAASQRFLAPRNRLYHWRLLASMKRECFGGAAEVSAEESDRVQRAQSIYEFDDHFVAPRNGFDGAEHYYAENQARRFIALVDEFYDRNVKLIVSAAADVGSLYAGRKLEFEFQRTTSRLVEMQSTEYLHAPHLC